MSELEEKLGTVLSNPQMMQQIMSLAQSLGQNSPPEEPKQDPPPEPGIDPGLIQALTGLMQQSSVDEHQQALLGALAPYLSKGRVSRLERAMRAARMTQAVSGLLNTGVFNSLIGR